MSDGFADRGAVQMTNLEAAILILRVDASLENMTTSIKDIVEALGVSDRAAEIAIDAWLQSFGDPRMGWEADEDPDHRGRQVSALGAHILEERTSL